MTEDDKSESAKKREDIIRKVKSLRQRTTDRGCTEAEALAAAEHAARLMEKYDLEMDEIDAKDAGVVDERIKVHPEFEAFVGRVNRAIAEFCQVRTWRNTNRSVVESQSFFGLPQDVEIALYLAEICERAMIHEVNIRKRGWMLKPRLVGKLTRSFLDGMSERLARRILELHWKRQRATGTALVPVKHAIIKQALDDLGIELTSSKDRYRDVDPKTFMEGRRAGEKVSLNAGVGSSQSDDDRLT